MSRSKRFLIGGVVILAALAYIIYGGLQEAVVYFKLPSEVSAKDADVKEKFLRMGGMVVKGSLQADVKNLTYRFQLSDGSATVPVYFKGIPPDLFIEGQGAVVEGRIGNDGVFHATTIMAKHAEEYSPHADGKGPKNNFVPVKDISAQ